MSSANHPEFPSAPGYNLRMSKTVAIDQRSSVALPAEAPDALGVEAGAELEVEIVVRALVVRSVEEAKRSREFISISNQSSPDVGRLTKN